MRIIEPFTPSNANLTASSIPEGDGTWTAWSSGTTYAKDALVGVVTGTAVSIYRSLQAGNTNHAPASSPTWWALASTTYRTYDPGVTYAAGNRVVSTVTHRIYESVVAGNVGIDPTTDSDKSHWVNIGPTNRWAMLDEAAGTRAEMVGGFSMTMAPGRIDAVAVLDTNAEVITVTLTVDGDEVYSRTQSTNVGGDAIDNWYDYFFAPIGTRDIVIFDDVPRFSNGILTVEFSPPNDATQPTYVGTLAAGPMTDLGSTEVGAEASLIDFSKKERDDFGVWTIVPRGFSGQMTVRCLCPFNASSMIYKLMAKNRAKPLVWIGSDDFDPLIIYGFFRDFSIDYASSRIQYGRYTIEGLYDLAA